MSMSRAPRSSSLGREARLGRSCSPVRFATGGAMHPGEEKETMRGLNERLADYLRQVRLLEEANSKLEAQIKEVLAQRRAAGQRDWSGYEKTLSDLRDQVKEMMMDNARLMLQIDNTRLAADDYKVKLEAEITIHKAVDQDITSLRKMIDDTHMSRMQLESEVESLTEELIYLKKSHEEDVANVKDQIRDSSVEVHTEPAKGNDLMETIDKIRDQYEKAALKSREEAEAWFQGKFENISAEVSMNTDALQQGQSELNDLRRQKQGMEIEVQSMHSMNHSLEDTLNDILGQYSQKVNGYNKVIQQLEAELAEVRAQVKGQGAEYQALLNIKSKLEEEIATYHSLLEGTWMPLTDVTDPRFHGNSGFKGMGERDDVNIKNIGQSEDVNIGGNGLGGDDDSVEFSLEQALSAEPKYLIPEPMADNEIVEEEQMAQKDLELNAANTALNKQYDQNKGRYGKEEDPVILGEIQEETERPGEDILVEKKISVNLVEEGEVERVEAVRLHHTQVEKVEKPVSPQEDADMEKVELSVSSVVAAQVEEAVSLHDNAYVDKVEEAASPQENTDVEKVESSVSPVVAAQVEEAVSLHDNAHVEKVEEAANPQKDTDVEKVVVAVSHVLAAQVEEAVSLQEDTQMEKIEEAVNNTEVEKGVNPVVDAKVEESVRPAEDSPVEETVILQETTQPKQEVELKSSVENINADKDEKKEKEEEPENPEAEALQNVEE